MGCRFIRRHVLAVTLLAILVRVSTVQAQSTGLSQAVLALPHSVSPDSRLTIVDGRLYGGRVLANIRDADGDLNNFSGADRIALTLVPRSGTARPLSFEGTRPEFDQWVRSNASSILAKLFPGNLSAAVSGRSAAQLSSQQLLLTRALGTDSARQASLGSRSRAGGMFEYEWFNRAGREDTDSGWAWQGLYGIKKTLSLQGRFAEQHEDITTRAARSKRGGDESIV